MGNGILNLQAGMGTGILSNIASTLTNVKANIGSRLPAGGMASKALTDIDIAGPLSRGETPKLPKLGGYYGGGGMAGYSNSPLNQSFQPTPPGGNLILERRGDTTTRSFRMLDDMPGNTRRF